MTSISRRPWLVARSYLLPGLLTLALLLGACNKGGDDDDDTTPSGDDDTTAGDDDTTAADDDTAGDDDQTDVSAYAGTYLVGFQRDGSQFALASFVVADDGSFVADAASSEGFTVDVTGTVEADGTVTVTSITNTAGLDIQVLTSQIHENGTLDGTYSVGEEEGIFAGSKDNAFTEDERTTDFDGSYELTTLKEGEETASTVFIIDSGRFELQLDDIFDGHYEAAGYVTSDGTVVLDTLASNESVVLMAEASIDQETFELSGLWRLDDNVGQLQGRRSD